MNEEIKLLRERIDRLRKALDAATKVKKYRVGERLHDVEACLRPGDWEDDKPSDSEANCSL
jgi:hypothetical protein